MMNKYINWLYNIFIVSSIALVIIGVIWYYKTKEGFQDNAGTGNNEINQQGNLIATNNDITLHLPINLNISTGNKTFPYKTELQLKDTYLITQLRFENLVTPNSNISLRIGIRNTTKNELQFVNFADLLEHGTEPIDTESSTYITKTTFNTTKSELYISNPTNIYGNQLIGDRIIIYTNPEINTDCDMYCFGFLEKDNYKASVYQMAKLVSNDIYIGAYSNINTQIPGSQTDDYLISSFQIVKNTSSPIISECNTPQLFKIVFRNNYTNDIVTYPGPVNGYFIYDPKLSIQTITLTSTMVATKFSICSTACGGSGTDVTQCTTVNNIKGYTASIADINRFKLEYNITDIRGSINPDDVCPSIDKFVENQLSSELIIDAMDYQKKINDEKAKLQSNKDNLLNLLEQQDEIKQLGRLIGKIHDVTTTREHQTNAINALQLFKQLNEYTKLKEVLDDRIALRKGNTFNIDVNVSKDVNDNKDIVDIEQFTNINTNININTPPINNYLLPEDNYKLMPK